MKTRTFYVAPPRVFPLSVRATFERELQIFTHKFTPLSIPHIWYSLTANEEKKLKAVCHPNEHTDRVNYFTLR